MKELEQRGKLLEDHQSSVSHQSEEDVSAAVGQYLSHAYEHPSSPSYDGTGLQSESAPPSTYSAGQPPLMPHEVVQYGATELFSPPPATGPPISSFSGDGYYFSYGDYNDIPVTTIGDSLVPSITHHVSFCSKLNPGFMTIANRGRIQTPLLPAFDFQAAQMDNESILDGAVIGTVSQDDWLNNGVNIQVYFIPATEYTEET